jgi:site-specific DNA-methyltransferase (adenine-specific)
MDGDDPVLGKPFVGEPHSVCSQTYLVIGYDQSQHILSQKECENIVAYISTKFFRYLVSLKKHTQHASRGVYQFVPIQDFSQTWTDERLYKKYGLDPEEIAFVEAKIRTMDLSDD